MRIVGVDLKSVRVDSFSVINESVVLELFFNDGADKQIFRTTDMSGMGNAKQLASDIIKEVVRMEKNINVKFDGDRITGSTRVVVNNEEEKLKALTRFLEGVNAKMQRIKSRRISDGYLDLLREIRNMEAAV